MVYIYFKGSSDAKDKLINQYRYLPYKTKYIEQATVLKLSRRITRYPI